MLYRTRDGDVVKVNVDTHHTTVIVPNQLFVSVVWLWHIVHPCALFTVTTAAWCSLPSRTDPGHPSTKCHLTCNTCCLPLKWSRWEREKKNNNLRARPSVATLQHLFCCNHAVCLCRSTNTPIWPSTLFTALWHSKLRLLLCACLSLSPVRLIIFLPGTLPCPRPDPVLAAGWRHSRVPASLHCFLAISFSLAFGPFFSLSSIYVCLPPYRCAFAASQVSLCA